MKKCKDCKWWKLWAIQRNEKAYGDCMNDDLEKSLVVHNEPVATVEDFGCVFWEAK
jgi:hypothetical protein